MLLSATNLKTELEDEMELELSPEQIHPGHLGAASVEGRSTTSAGSGSCQLLKEDARLFQRIRRVHPCLELSVMKGI